MPIILALLWWEEMEIGESRKLGSHVTWGVLASSTKDPVTNKADSEDPHKCVSSPSVWWHMHVSVTQTHAGLESCFNFPLYISMFSLL